jgi:hypothetical protein
MPTFDASVTNQIGSSTPDVDNAFFGNGMSTESCFVSDGMIFLKYWTRPEEAANLRDETRTSPVADRANLRRVRFYAIA